MVGVPVAPRGVAKDAGRRYWNGGDGEAGEAQIRQRQPRLKAA